jgi:hypothetical protein
VDARTFDETFWLSSKKVNKYSVDGWIRRNLDRSIVVQPSNEKILHLLF